MINMIFLIKLCFWGDWNLNPYCKSQKKKCFVVIGPLFQHYTLLDIHLILFLLFLLHAEAKRLLRFASFLYPISLAFDNVYYLQKFVSLLSMAWVTISIAVSALSTGHKIGSWNNNNKNPTDKTCKIEHLKVVMSPKNLFHMDNTCLK